ncbi:MAG TPA: ABC transporter substrate-binding protein [Alphaproteobacteria bacterium]|nr:ABC transporter substrate-binding protein [Alphaproteobacteria bacterium]|tara:strand:+ start:2594 stop:3628 length:1035 start_codon:yes stop_codon:yes gene_type:complete
MRKLTTMLGAVAISMSFAQSAMAEKLTIYHWFEYIPQELLNKFTAETGIEVVMDTYDSNEALLANLKATGMGNYDVAVPGDYMVNIMRDEGMLDTFTPSELSNFSNIQDQWLNVSFDMGRQNSVPYQWGSTSFMVDREVYSGDIRTADIIFNPPAELKGKINILDTAGETLAFASLYMGIPQCSNDRSELKKLSAMLQDAKVNWASFNSDGAKDVLASGDVAAGMIWNGFGAKARAERASLEYSYPKEGYLVWADSVVLLKDAPNRDAALKFMDFLLEPENAATVTNYARYTAGVKGVEEFLDAELVTSPENNPPADAPAGTFVEVCSPETQALYDAIWTQLKK